MLEEKLFYKCDCDQNCQTQRHSDKMLLLLLFATVCTSDEVLSNTTAIDYTTTTAQEEGVTTILQTTTAKSTTVKTTVAVGWGDWSPWSKCSRSCDSGLQYRERVCLNSTGCRGEPLQYQICSIHPCPPSAPEWRDEQCSRYNPKPYEGDYYEWISEEGKDFPCRLDCKPKGGPEEKIVTLKERVEDGTRCGHSGLSVCLAGSCQEVGCDLVVNSGAKLDRCGVCGGDGSSCQDARYTWTVLPLSRCSASCGTGRRMVTWQCVDTLAANQVVDYGLCDVGKRPDINMEYCNSEPCPPRWEVSSWSQCDTECGGFRSRKVECVMDHMDNKIKMTERDCQGERPVSTDPCPLQDSCPTWSASPWSQCSVECGLGTQTREVKCVLKSGEPSSFCTGSKPVDIQPCTADCAFKPKEPNVSKKRLEESSAGESEDDISLNLIEDKKQPKATREKSVVKTQASFVAGEWSSCSATCGEGIRWRKVQCKILLEFSGTIATLPDKECPGVKPEETEICVENPTCSPDLSAQLVTATLPVQQPNILPLLQQEEPYTGPAYIWKISGYTECTASCLGGLQESVVVCVEAEKETLVSPYFCDAAKRIEIEVRSCNEKPCPPRWNVSDFSECSQTCGGGNQNRTVECIQEVAHGMKNVIKLAETECPQPPPISQQFCNVIDCPVQWNTGEWTKCSSRCGEGRRYRKVRCSQLLSLGQRIDKPEGECRGNKPWTEEQCIGVDCSPRSSAEPKIRFDSDQKYEQKNPGNNVIKLKIGGKANVYQGTTIKLRCPVKYFNKSEIMWYFNGNEVGKGSDRKFRHHKLSVSRKGVLRIKDIGQEEAGTYACSADDSRGEIHIEVKYPENNYYNREYSGVPHNNVLNHDAEDRGKWNEYIYWDSFGGDDVKANSPQPHNQHNINPNNNQHQSIQQPEKFPFERNTKKRRRKNKRRHKNLKHKGPLAWVTGKWGVCSNSCQGQQKRDLSCQMQLRQSEDPRIVPHSFCTAAKLKKPRQVRKCGGKCAKWIHSPWTPCNLAECISRHTGLMTRSVDCLEGGKLVDESRCENEAKPESKQSCQSKECIGVWVLGEWSQCTRTCGNSERRRSVSCEWLRGGHAPVTECQDDRPSSMMRCQAPDCAPWQALPVLQVVGAERDGRNTKSPCEDTSKFCPIVKSYNMCHKEKYSEQCCKSCSAALAP